MQDKTAQFVARNGYEFEKRCVLCLIAWLFLAQRCRLSILANEKNNVKFNFLLPGDPYNAYYQHKV